MRRNDITDFPIRLVARARFPLPHPTQFHAGALPHHARWFDTRVETGGEARLPVPKSYLWFLRSRSERAHSLLTKYQPTAG
jgi:hypothetical protein